MTTQTAHGGPAASARPAACTPGPRTGPGPNTVSCGVRSTDRTPSCPEQGVSRVHVVRQQDNGAAGSGGWGGHSTCRAEPADDPGPDANQCHSFTLTGPAHGAHSPHCCTEPERAALGQAHRPAVIPGGSGPPSVTLSTSLLTPGLADARRTRAARVASQPALLSLVSRSHSWQLTVPPGLTPVRPAAPAQRRLCTRAGTHHPPQWEGCFLRRPSIFLGLSRTFPDAAAW